MANVLGDKIRDLRKEKKLTLDKLAELTSSSKSYIWELENKNPPRPSAEKLSRIAEHLMDEKNELKAEDAVDAQFYRKYRNLPDETRQKIRKITDMWDDEE